MIAKRKSDSGSYGSEGCHIRKLDNLAKACVMSVYCNCGRIVSLDRSEMNIRLGLGKELECTVCRNRRISSEIDSINNYYNGVEEAETS